MYCDHVILTVTSMYCDHVIHTVTSMYCDHMILTVTSLPCDHVILTAMCAMLSPPGQPAVVPPPDDAISMRRNRQALPVIPGLMHTKMHTECPVNLTPGKANITSTLPGFEPATIVIRSTLQTLEKRLEDPGIDPGTSHMLSERSTT